MSEDAPEKIAAKVMAIDIKITEEYDMLLVQHKLGQLPTIFII